MASSVFLSATLIPSTHRRSSLCRRLSKSPSLEAGNRGQSEGDGRGIERGEERPSDSFGLNIPLRDLGDEILALLIVLSVRSVHLTDTHSRTGSAHVRGACAIYTRARTCRWPRVIRIRSLDDAKSREIRRREISGRRFDEDLEAAVGFTDCTGGGSRVVLFTAVYGSQASARAR